MSPSHKTGSSVLQIAPHTPPVKIEIALLTGGGDRPYALGLASALLSKGFCLDFIGSDDLDCPELRRSSGLRFLNLRGSQHRDASLAKKVSRILIYYARLIRYASVSHPRIFHILWNNKFQYFDRTVLMLYYRLLGKKVAFTAHNVNAGKRDSNDSLLNRITLRIQYRLADHIFVHTERMKRDLLEEFGVREGAVTFIPFGINNSVPNTEMTPVEAKRRLGIKAADRTILFFGNIGPYKGLEFLVEAFQSLVAKNPGYRLIIAGSLRDGSKRYWCEIQRMIRRDPSLERVIERIEYIPDEETELYFKAADILALPYTYVSQSGVLLLAYSFGLPVIATDVGSLRDDIVEGKTGFLCRPRDSIDLARALETYFASGLFKTLDSRRQEIRDYAHARHSWDIVSETTWKVYTRLLEEDGS